ncbi:unnamed protein product [Rhizopus stolonifer]
MKSRKLIVQLLRILWIVVLLYNEIYIFWNYSNHLSSQLNKHDKNILLIADPQMTDDMSYDRPWIVMKLTEFYSALYMKRNYKRITNSVKPYQIFIMGDLMDSGREWGDAFYSKEVKRFRKIFNSKYETNYMVGNHDVGFGDGIKPQLITRFQKYFGQASYVVQDENYSFLVLDTVSLSSQNPEIRDIPLALLKNYNASNTILFTHVPLYREPDATCGPFRQSTRSQTIRDEYGYQYQNMVSKELSEYILNTVKPILVLSGDDHDYCEVTHQHSIQEITVPTFSMAQGLEYPGVMVLSVTKTGSLYTKLFWLPSQIKLFIQYAYLLVFTLLFVMIYEYRQTKYSGAYSHELPMTSKATEVHPHKRTCASSFVHSLKDIGFIPLLTYIICIMFL